VLANSLIFSDTLFFIKSFFQGKNDGICILIDSTIWRHNGVKLLQNLLVFKLTEGSKNSPAWIGLSWIVLIAPVESKKLGTIRTTGTVVGFDIIVSIASKTRDAQLSVMFLGMTTEVLHVRPKQAKHIWGILIRERTSWLAVCLFCRFWGVTRWKCSIKTQRQLASGLGTTSFSDIAHTRCEHFCSFSFGFRQRLGLISSLLIE